MLRRVRQFLLDCLFPIFCLGCKQEGVWWCEACQAKEPPQPTQFFPGSSLMSVTTFFIYAPTSIATRLIKLYKYHSATELGELWGKVITPPEVFGAPTIIPVPLFKRRLRERGFNQAEELAKILAAKTGWPLETRHLVRVRATKQQAKLNKVEREANMASAFAWVSSEPAPVEVVLVDDVVTTGVTLQACAAELIAHGSAQVQAIALATGHDGNIG